MCVCTYMCVMWRCVCVLWTQVSMFPMHVCCLQVCFDIQGTLLDIRNDMVKEIGKIHALKELQFKGAHFYQNKQTKQTSIQKWLWLRC